ncbi:MAG: type II toxin-antitoxin system RelE/ParE family toxin [Candidatus Gastranaerophilales bacterium]|nr:type II toxin-antitoxin system RelE/ParE family toxin [Candidatus Gastranaerophilales bacterium]
MIISFKCKETEKIFDKELSKKFSKDISKIAKRKLDMLNAAYKEQDLIVPPSNRFEKLKGDLKDYYSIRINDQYRIIFKFINGNAEEVQIIDYH